MPIFDSSLYEPPWTNLLAACKTDFPRGCSFRVCCGCMNKGGEAKVVHRSFSYLGYLDYSLHVAEREKDINFRPLRGKEGSVGFGKHYVYT
jgi:hypothetical protein